ncbi:hypothetical protein SKAU_G00303340 [Synaphobranchus kaupii]|uniref:Uncharacterized protein n=1 Tax=Synaphobranchus kaupii TaxID=118154 RepID=A0A9Q1EW78_SYNKA|nr:hypothetical protein SKAU_G00303340 [Synaphobranchus kaupii]
MPAGCSLPAKLSSYFCRACETRHGLICAARPLTPREKTVTSARSSAGGGGETGAEFSQSQWAGVNSIAMGVSPPHQGRPVT